MVLISNKAQKCSALNHVVMWLCGHVTPRSSAETAGLCCYADFAHKSSAVNARIWGKLAFCRYNCEPFSIFAALCLMVILSEHRVCAACCDVYLLCTW